MIDCRLPVPDETRRRTDCCRRFRNLGAHADRMGVTLVTERANIAVGLAVTVALAEAKVAELQELPVLVQHCTGSGDVRLASKLVAL